MEPYYKVDGYWSMAVELEMGCGQRLKKGTIKNDEMLS